MTFQAAWGCASDFYPSARWALMGIVVPARAVSAAARGFFGYYTNMVQQIKFIIELFIQTFKPSWHLAIIISFSTYFFLNPLETWYRYIGFQGLRVYWHCPFSCAIQTLDIAAILILSLIFYYWHNIYWKRLCQICGHFESVHQQSVFECLHSIF